MSDKPRLRRQLAALLGFLATSYVVSMLGSLPIIGNASGWYEGANKAPWTPPAWVFSTAWMMLYTAMAVAAWLVWRQRSTHGRRAMTACGVQLLLNLAWPSLFFGAFPQLGTTVLWLAFLVIAALVLAVIVTVLHFGPISRTAGLLLLPYISWIVFSSSLNFYAAASN